MRLDNQANTKLVDNWCARFKTQSDFLESLSRFHCSAFPRCPYAESPKKNEVTKCQGGPLLHSSVCLDDGTRLSILHSNYT